jgi:hypothetical protein
MERRTVLKLGLAAGVGTACAGIVGIRYALLSREDVIEQTVRHYIGDENLVPGAAARFAQDFAPHSWAGRRHRVGMALSVHFTDPWRDALPDEIDESLEEYERRVVTVFIQSSDISGHPRELKNPIDYNALTLEPVCNPFARLRT